MRTNSLASTSALPREAAGAVASVLSALRIEGQLLLNESYTPPWSVEVPHGERLATLAGVEARSTLIPFHFVKRGGLELEVGRRRLRLTEGEIALVISPVVHRLREGAAAKAVSFEALLTSKRRPTEGPTELLCGVFALQNASSSPLLASLPPIVQVPVVGPSASALSRAIGDLLLVEMSSTEPRAWVTSRCLELLCCEVLLCAPTSVRGNWLAGARDTGIAKVLSAVHASPGQPWTVARLARLASLSPSRFAARFRELVGCSPMTYVTSWRMSLAAQRLRQGGDRVDEVGRGLGYESHAAFSRAFRRHAGQSPSSVAREGLLR